MKKHLILFIFIFVFTSLHFYKVISHVTPFFDWDEGIYAQVGREMISEKSYLVPLWQGKVWLDKPPLPPLVYGLAGLIPIAPEITMRMVSVVLSAIVLILFYVFAYRVSGSAVVAIVSTVITSFLPPFIQRTQVLNVDVFLLIGWFGYVLFYKKRVTGALFLLIGTLSKSLLGFFPAVMIIFYETYTYLTHSKKKDIYSFRYDLQNIILHIGVSLIWFIWMFGEYRGEFIQYHFLDSHLKRVTASIEQHFGQRTFYIDIIVEQFKWFLIPALISIGVIGYDFFIKKNKATAYAVIFIPWFIFLNLTKTKIAWYIYPVLPQFALLTVYWVRYIKTDSLKIVFAGLILILFFKYNTPITAFLTTDYSKWEDYQRVAQDAKTVGCTSLDVLVDKTTRESYATLKSMDLVINTTTWWGNHPSIAYYADIPTQYAYTTDELIRRMNSRPQNSCLMVMANEEIDVSPYRILSKKGEYELRVKD